MQQNKCLGLDLEPQTGQLLWKKGTNEKTALSMAGGMCAGHVIWSQVKHPLEGSGLMFQEELFLPR